MTNRRSVADVADVVVKTLAPSIFWGKLKSFMDSDTVSFFPGYLKVLNDEKWKNIGRIFNVLILHHRPGIETGIGWCYRKNLYFEAFFNLSFSVGAW